GEPITSWLEISWSTDMVVGGIRNEEIARRVDGQSIRTSQRRFCRQAAVSAVRLPADPRHSTDDSSGAVDFSHPVVVPIADEEIARAVHRQGVRVSQPGTGGRATIPGESGHTGSGNRR